VARSGRPLDAYAMLDTMVASRGALSVDLETVGRLGWEGTHWLVSRAVPVLHDATCISTYSTTAIPFAVQGLAVAFE
jgi:hypothetical protein